MTKLFLIGLSCSFGLSALVGACGNESSTTSPQSNGSQAGSAASAGEDGALPESGAPATSGGAGAGSAVGGGDSSSGGADSSNGGQDGSGAGVGGTTNTVDPSACNALPIDAPEVSATAVPSAPGSSEPLPAGGKIADGKYFLTAHESYGVDPKDLLPATYRTTIVIAGSQLELAQIKDGVETRATFVVTTSDKKFHAETTCPGPGQSLAYDSFTATDATLVLFDDEKVVTLTLQ